MGPWSSNHRQVFPTRRRFTEDRSAYSTMVNPIATLKQFVPYLDTRVIISGWTVRTRRPQEEPLAVTKLGWNRNRPRFGLLNPTVRSLAEPANEQPTIAVTAMACASCTIPNAATQPGGFGPLSLLRYLFLLASLSPLTPTLPCSKQSFGTKSKGQHEEVEITENIAKQCSDIIIATAD